MTDQEKEDIQREIVEKIANNLGSQELSVEEAQKIAEYVLEEIDLVENEEQKLIFLHKLVKQWPMFANLLQTEEGKKSHREDQLAVGEVLKLTKEGKINEALALAKSANRD